MLKLSLSLRNYTRLTRAITDVSRISDGGCTNIKANRKNERSAEISERLVRKKKIRLLIAKNRFSHCSSYNGKQCAWYKRT